MRDTLPALDYDAFARDLDAVRAELGPAPTAEDLAHLQRMARWGRACTAFGYATSWIAPNPLSAVALSLGMTARWTIVAHHVMHRGVDRAPGVPENFTRKRFARGWRRFIDWPEWMVPAAWDHEHNHLHHARTGDPGDPDLVEAQTVDVRAAKIPRVFKYAVVGFYALTWKFTYYAPNTLALLRRAEARRAANTPVDPDASNNDMPVLRGLDPRTADGRAYWTQCALPYGLYRFVAIPAMYLPLGPWAALSTWANSVMAEALSSAHTFAIIGPNHCGDDLYRFDRGPRDRAEFYVRQVLGSANYRTGGDLNDFLHGFLNYQIEHHLWPDLAPAQYQRLAAKVRAVCEKHEVPYVQESVFARMRKLVSVMVGASSMRRGVTRSRSARDSARLAADAS
jgi:fatty acid desaturase